MKTALRLVLISTLYISVLSCKSKKSPAASVANTAQGPQANSAPIQPSASNENESRFMVSFYSIGQGIDGKTNDEFVNFLNTYPKKIAYTPAHWGREGEINYCLPLNELSASQQKEFITKANAILGKSSLVHVQENVKCEQPGRPPAPPALEDSYRLIVSFYSKGEGIDYQAKTDFEKFLNNYAKKIAYEPSRWGREGEVDYCLKMDELSSAEQTDFVNKAKELLIKSTLVHVDENAKCVHKH